MKAKVGEAASDLLHEGKKLAQEVYEDGVKKATEVEHEVKEYSDELLAKVQENPLAAVLIAGGVGFLLSMLLKK
ncbi:MAG TPA: hypothetical protein DDY37_03535 [Legionella sp.]|nr:hypothetical protein [Legionella sp.]